MKKPTPGQKLQSFKKPAPKAAGPRNLSKEVEAAGPMAGGAPQMPFKGKPKFGGKKPPLKGGGKF